MRRWIAAMLLAGCLLSGCSRDRTGSAVSRAPGTEEKSSSLSDSSSREEASAPSETGVGQLFCDAMTEINDLATEDPADLLRQKFEEVRILDGVVTVDQVPYMETSLPYEQLADYYGKIFTGDALDWVLSAKYADVDGMVYCSTVGGQSGIGFAFVSVEQLQGNTYEGTYRTNSSDGEQRTAFTATETDAGLRISGIDYRPASLD